jgi:hypothetical protein
MLVVVRSDLDRDDEHRREAERRVIAAETCKKNIEVLIFRFFFWVSSSSVIGKNS